MPCFRACMCINEYVVQEERSSRNANPGVKISYEVSTRSNILWSKNFVVGVILWFLVEFFACTTGLLGVQIS